MAGHEPGPHGARTRARSQDARERAAERTPHGMPIELRPGDFE